MCFSHDVPSSLSHLQLAPPRVPSLTAHNHLAIAYHDNSLRVQAGESSSSKPPPPQTPPEPPTTPGSSQVSAYIRIKRELTHVVDSPVSGFWCEWPIHPGSRRAATQPRPRSVPGPIEIADDASPEQISLAVAQAHLVFHRSYSPTRTPPCPMCLPSSSQCWATASG